MMRGGLGQRPLGVRGLAGAGRARGQGSRRRAARMQDRQGRRAGARRALPARPVPALWLPSLGEHLRWRMHPVRLRASAMNRIFGLLMQWDCASRSRLREPDGMELLADRGVEETWRRSIVEALAVIDLLDERVAPLERELRQGATDDPRVVLLKSIPGVGDLLGLTLASEIGDVARFSTPSKLIGYAGLAPRVHQSGDRARAGALSKAGSHRLRTSTLKRRVSRAAPSPLPHRPRGSLPPRCRWCIRSECEIAAIEHPQQLQLHRRKGGERAGTSTRCAGPVASDACSARAKQASARALSALS
jgi:hypothetical protein